MEPRVTHRDAEKFRDLGGKRGMRASRKQLQLAAAHISIGGVPSPSLFELRRAAVALAKAAAPRLAVSIPPALRRWLHSDRSVAASPRLPASSPSIT
jgi:hypothetical protein